MADNLNDLYKDRQKILADISRLKKEINAFNESEIEDEKKSRDLLVERKMLSEGLRNTNKLIREEQRGQYLESHEAARELTGIYQSLGRIDQERINKMVETLDLSQETIDRSNQIANLNREIAQLSHDDSLQRQILRDEVEHILELLHEEKSLSSDILGNLEKQSKVAYRLSKMTDAQLEQEESRENIQEKIKNALSNTFGIAQTLFDEPEEQLAAMVVGAGLLVNRFGDVRKELGGISSTSATIMSYFDSEAVGTFRELSNQFGSIEAASFGTQLNTSLMARTMGISGEEAATLVGSFARLNDGSTGIAEDLMASTQEFARQRGVIPAQVMSDLAQSTEAFALYGKDGGRNIAEAAVFARQLGTEFSTLEAVSSNLLDFETSINSELELSALLGRRINLDKARSLAFQGEIEAATRETLNQLGGINAWESMNVIERQQSAQALGLQVGQLDKMIRNQETAGQQTELIAERFSRWGTALDAFVNEALGTTISSLGGILIMVGQMGHGFQAISGIMQTIKSTSVVQWGIEKGRLALAKLRNLFMGKEVAMAQTRLATERQIAATQKTRTGGGGGGIASTMSNIDPMKLIKGAAAMVIAAGAVFVFAKAVQEFMKVEWGDIGMAVVSMFALVGAIAALGALMSSGVGVVAILAGAAAMLVVASSVFVLGKAIQEMATGFEMLRSVGDVITNLVSYAGQIMMLSGSLYSLAGSLTAVGLAGMISLPGLMAVQVATSVVERVTGGGVDEEGSVIQENHDELISEIRGLRNDLRNGNIAVYMDRDLVSKKVATGINESKVNSGGLL